MFAKPVGNPGGGGGVQLCKLHMSDNLSHKFLKCHQRIHNVQHYELIPFQPMVSNKPAMYPVEI